MIAMLILAIVCVAWLQIIGIQSARKEARRREAVERLTGMMDAFMYENRSKTSHEVNAYTVNVVTNKLEIKIAEDSNLVNPVFNEFKDGMRVSPIGYRLYVIKKSDLKNDHMFQEEWGNCKWLVGELYNHSECSKSEAGEPFFTLPVCLGL